KVEGAVLTFSDVTGLAQAEEQQRVLVAELNHRVKNMLTVIVSIATQTLKNSDDVEADRDAFLDRLHAMARAYELVSRDQWGDVSLLDVVRQEVEPYRTGRDDRVVIEGPAVSLKPKLALSLGMIIHELGTNSVKYGSLSAAGGSLEISWAVERRSGTSLVLDWIERGGPPVGKPPRHGFGLTLIEREVGHGLGGKAKIEFQDGGLRVNLRIPLDSPPGRATALKPKARSRILKKLPHPSGDNRARKSARLPNDRNLVRRRSARWPKEQDHATVGQARDPSRRAACYC